MHGQGKIAMNQIDLPGGDIVVHQLPVGGHEKRFARGALKIAKYFQHNGSALRAKGFVRIDVVHAIY
jgi:hypothetical protein